MFLEPTLGALMFVFLLIGVVAAYLGEMYAPVYKKKNHLITCADVCSGVAAYWIFAPIVSPAAFSGGILLFTLIVGLIFALITVYFYHGASKLKETS